jgi:hypothetical protein
MFTSLLLCMGKGYLHTGGALLGTARSGLLSMQTSTGVVQVA